jgi:hypothetical protein
MVYCYLPLLLDRSEIYIGQYNTDSFSDLGATRREGAGHERESDDVTTTLITGVMYRYVA